MLQSQRLLKERYLVSAAFYPLGTAFAIKSAARNILLTAYHIVSDNYAVANWFVTDFVDRNADGTWKFDSCNLIPVDVVDRDAVNDLAILRITSHTFAENDMIPLCPANEVPSVLDEVLFKTYYCPLGDCQFDKERPVLNIRVSGKKIMSSIKKTSDGRMWLDGGLCGGASGGAVVDSRGRVVAMHTESYSDVMAIEDIHKKDKRVKKTNSKDKADALESKVEALESKFETLSEAHDSSAHSYSSSQYCILLSLNRLVLNHIR